MSLRLLFAAVISLFLGACVSPGAARFGATRPPGLPATVLHKLNAAGIPPDAMGAVVIRLSDGATILSHRADSSMQPASTMKLVTTIVGLERLGPTMRWKTELRAAGALEDGILRGDLFLRGGGDGDLDWEAFDRMLLALRNKGIRRIDGDLVLDRGMFQPARTDVGAPPFDESPEFQYNVIPDALLINTNLLRLELEANDRMLSTRMTPELSQVSIENQMELVDRSCDKWEDGWQVPALVKASDGSIRIQLRGTFPRNCSNATSINVLERNDYCDRLFRQLWARHGGEFNGTTREGSAPQETRLLAEHFSRTLADMLRKINKPSDNPLSRIMFLALGSQSTFDRGTSFEKADREVRAWLTQLGIGDEGLITENGSGLSRRERIRPAQLAGLLAAAHKSNWAPEFLSSLPVAGLDGTMRKRLRDSAAAGRARMKTGTLRNVVALAGYVPDATDNTNVVVAIINHETASGKLSPVGQPVLDALVDWVARSGTN